LKSGVSPSMQRASRLKMLPSASTLVISQSPRLDQHHGPGQGRDDEVARVHPQLEQQGIWKTG
jgi:hypothetical protein